MDSKQGARYRKRPQPLRVAAYEIIEFIVFLVAGAGFTQDPTVKKWV